MKIQQVEEQKTIMETARKKIKQIMGVVPNIDSLMRDKVDEYILTEELPCPIRIGEKVIYVGNFNLGIDNTFFRDYTKIIGNLGLQVVNFELLKDGLELYKYLKIHKRLEKNLCRLIKNTVLKQQKFFYEGNAKHYKLNKCSYKYFRDHISKEKLIQMCYLIYLYNYDASKNALALIANKMGIGAQSQTYIYSWLENCPGLTGKFLLRQLQDLDWWHNDLLKSTEEKDHLKEDNNV